MYAPNVIVPIICNNFFPRRGLDPCAPGLGGGPPPVFNEDRVASDMSQFHYVRLDAKRRAPRGARDWVVVLVLAADGKYSQHSPDLRRLVAGVEAERPAKEHRLDELIVVAEDEFFGKKNLTDVVNACIGRQPGGPDPGGASPFYSAYPYCRFAVVVPDHVSVPRHRVLDPEETRRVLDRERRARADLPVVLSNDPAIVWCGGREGQVVEITRDSQTACLAIYYRRIERGAI